jgi:hypothetical protein
MMPCRGSGKCEDGTELVFQENPADEKHQRDKDEALQESDEILRG